MSEESTRSPLLNAVVLASVFTLVGTGLGTVLQGYWQTELERQKFEAVLIQQALQPESKRGICEEPPFSGKCAFDQQLG